MKIPAASAIVLFGMAKSAIAESAPSTLALQSDVDHVWTITAAVLVFFMQAGFLLLEAGSVRSKNSVNVAQKNLMDFVISTVTFGLVGYMLMFGTSVGGLVGWQPQLALFGSAGEWSLTFFVFQLMFCGTAATIMSGAVAERMTINGYLTCAVLIATLIYPIAGHWVWGGLLNGGTESLLAARGFHDFAGSTVVHGVGAWVALAAIVLVGPRLGKFDETGKPRVLHGHSPVLATTGALILWVGWIGFNGGSLLTGSGEFAPVIVNTMVAGGAGGATLMILGRLTSGLFRPEATINGMLGGLVAITAGADLMTPQTSFAIGSLGGVTVLGATWFLEHVLKLDDPLGAVSVHGFAGVMGTLCVALFAPVESLPLDSRMEQLLVQFTGVGLVFAWSFGVAFAALKGIALVLGPNPEGRSGLRVPELHELEGLNVHEHNAPMGTGILQEAMAHLARNHATRPGAITIDHGDEAYETSVLFNQILENIAAERDEEEARYQSNKAKRMQVESEIAQVVEACSLGDFSHRLETSGRDGFLLELCRGINGLCDVTERTITSVSRSLEAVSQGDLTQTFEGDFQGQIAEIQGALNGMLSRLSRMLGEVQHTVDAAGRGDFTNLIDLADKPGFFKDLCDSVNAICQTFESGLSDLSEVLGGIGDGDLTLRMNDGYKGQFAEISGAVMRMCSGVSTLANSVRHAAEAVSDSGSEIATSSAMVMQGSASQVEALETATELVTALSQTAATVAGDAKDADNLCRHAQERSAHGRELSDGLLLQIDDILSATRLITQALEQIESIATQTTLISLNASVEAQRAGGSSGSTAGFKVVAEEVRELARQSTEVAAQIRERTAIVQSAVSRGAKMVHEAASALSEINSAMQQSSEKVGRLLEGGRDQADRARQLEQEVADISHKAEKNLQLANECRSLSKAIGTMSSETMEHVSCFRMIDTNRKSAA